ncbi:TetR/AcrR family transcriptional regulator [Bacillus sp. FJAT-45350]|uniref:TetR/AcrR family transcriptional regulator n=1 Tax=Bacillus sp. FJAT-45350 TaxID=2011014 RepID=UPI000BB91553|nr:TetR/AcrR family transcriptional regulator [Bacillus sp. FJAT-45350]
MTTAKRIKQVALNQFIERGYEGASLAIIAEEVGIKKQSIYTHYKSKQDLFFQVTNQVIRDEIEFIHNYFEIDHSTSTETLLYQFILSIKERFTNEKDVNVNFMLRMAFMPPNDFKEDLITEFHSYFNRLEDCIEAVLSMVPQLSISIAGATSSFITIFEGLLVELIYGNVETFENKLNETWKVYWRGITV